MVDDHSRFVLIICILAMKFSLNFLVHSSFKNTFSFIVSVHLSISEIDGGMKDFGLGLKCWLVNEIFSILIDSTPNWKQKHFKIRFQA